MVIQLDISNAFNRVRHEFLFSIMRWLDFKNIDIMDWGLCRGGPMIVLVINGRTISFKVLVALRKYFSTLSIYFHPYILTKYGNDPRILCNNNLWSLPRISIIQSKHYESDPCLQMTHASKGLYLITTKMFKVILNYFLEAFKVGH